MGFQPGTFRPLSTEVGWRLSHMKLGFLRSCFLVVFWFRYSANLQTGMEPPKFDQFSKATSFLRRGFAASMISWGIHECLRICSSDPALIKIWLDFLECDARMFWPRLWILYVWINESMAYSFLICLHQLLLALNPKQRSPTNISISPFLFAGMCSLIILGNSNPNPKGTVWGNFKKLNLYYSAIPFPFGGWGCCVILGIWLGNTPSIPWFSMIYFPWILGWPWWWCRRSRRWTRTYTWDLCRVCYLFFACVAIRGQSGWDRISKEKGAKKDSRLS